MNKIFRGTLEVKTEVLDQNAISDSNDPLKEVARHVSTPSLAWTNQKKKKKKKNNNPKKKKPQQQIISHYRRRSSWKRVKLDRTELIQPDRILMKARRGKRVVKIPGEYRDPPPHPPLFSLPLLLECRFVLFRG